MFLLNIQKVLGQLASSCQKRGMMAITFDDGPTAYTEKLLKILEAEKVKATFHFNLGSINDGIRSTIKKCDVKGHDVGLRTNSLRDYYSIKEGSVIKNDLKKQIDVIKAITGKSVKYARSPIKNNQVQPEVYKFFCDNSIVQTVPSHSPYDTNTEVKKSLKNYLDLKSPEIDSGIIAFYEERLKEDNNIKYFISTIRSYGFTIVPLSECVGKYGSAKSDLSYASGKKESGINTILNKNWIPILSHMML